MSAEVSANEQDVAAASGAAQPFHSVSRAGYLPVALSAAPVMAFEGLPLYVRPGTSEATADTQGQLALYRAEHTCFTAQDRERLLQSGTKFVYIRLADHRRFLQQTEAALEAAVADPKIALSTKARLVYETSLALVDDLLADPDLTELTPRVEGVSRAVTGLVMHNPSAFSHLFAISHHDFYTATHMVNVATWMVPLAYALDYRDTDVLNQICQAGLLHDIGKLYVPEEILNKRERLSPGDWDVLKRHPELGCQHLRKYAGIPELVLNVTRQHHERLDGSGYPAGLLSREIEPFSKICAVVDSFDAMTALRPFKKDAFSVSEACEVLAEVTPRKYDPDVVAAWVELLRSAKHAQKPNKPRHAGSASVVGAEKRAHVRYDFSCPARLHLLEWRSGGWNEGPGHQVTTHSISRSGMGILSHAPVPLGTHVHVYLQTRAWNRKSLRALVLRCRPYTDGWHEVGLEFISDGSQSKPTDA